MSRLLSLGGCPCIRLVRRLRRRRSQRSSSARRRRSGPGERRCRRHWRQHGWKRWKLLAEAPGTVQRRSRRCRRRGRDLPTPHPNAMRPPPSYGPKRKWNHSVSSPLIVASGFANHRGRDFFFAPGDPQWVIGKFAYGLSDKDLKEEEVDVYLLRNCSGSWEKLTTASTTTDGSHATVLGTDDSGGRIYYQIPKSKELGLGRHRIHLVVAGDHSNTDLFIEVVKPTTRFFVSGCGTER